MKKYREPCGCVSDDIRWIVLCDEHKREWRELHERANPPREPNQESEHVAEG